MNSRPDPNLLSASPTQNAPIDGVQDTFWGYVVVRATKSRWWANQGEGFATIGCLLFGTAAFAQWLWPGASNEAMLAPIKFGATAIFFVISGSLYMMAKRGLSNECQIDLHERMVRLVRRNRSNECVVTKSLPFEGIEDVEVQQSWLPFQSASLVVRAEGGEDEIVLRTGRSDALSLLGQRVRRDIFSVD